MVTLIRPGVRKELRKSRASTNIMESVNVVIARVSRNVTRWRNALMGLRWTAAGMLMAQQGFRRVNGHIHLPELADALDRIYKQRTGRKSGWVPLARRETRSRSRTGFSRRCRGRRVEAGHPQCHARSLPESAGSPPSGSRNPEMSGAERE